MKNTHFLVQRSDFFQTTFEEQDIPSLQEGQVLLQIETFAFTSNNITYAVVGDRLNYWDFFPAESPWGRVPVWGYARVVKSANPDVKMGERFYGYFPMSKYLIIHPPKVSVAGIADGSAHRQELSPIYNFYSRVTSDTTDDPVFEAYFPIVRPLFATSFLSYHFLKEEAFFQASQLILSSASSKTALALAYMLKTHQKEDGKSIIGLTSPGNQEFVQQTDLYDQVIAYPDLDENLPVEDSVVVDFAGSTSLMVRTHELLGEKLKYISRIGFTDWQGGDEVFQHPNSHFFFAPTQGKSFYQKLGRQEANRRITTAMKAFVDMAKAWISIQYLDDPATFAALFGEALEGKIDPGIGYLVRPDHW